VNSSISRTLVFWLAVPLTLLALCGALIHYFNNVAPQFISTDRHLKEISAGLIAHLHIEDGRVHLRQNAGGLPLLPSDGSVRFALRDQQHDLLDGDARLPLANVDATNNAIYQITQIDGHNLRVLTTGIDTPAGPVTLSAATDFKPNEAAARYGFLSTLLWDFVQLDITLVLVWVGIQLGLRPVRRLRDEVAQRSPQDLRAITETSVPRELAPLTATLNRLFQTLRTSVQSQQQFIANTAHQLRTPITAMLAQLDLLVAEPAAEPVKQRLTTLQEGVRQLAHAANQLLTLARADPAANITSKTELIGLQIIAAEVVAKFFDRALGANIDLGADLQPAMVLADASLLDDLLSNLVDNALKYTPSGGLVTVSVARRNGQSCLSVEDTGPGIPTADRVRVRQRFYRLPNSPGHGSGLGLAIVEEIAGLYGAELRIESGADGHGTRVTVNFTDAG
jgi:two-component system sensor histidine kinase TctE